MHEAPGPRNALTVDVEEWYHVCRAERFVPRASWGRLESRVRPALDRLLRLFAARGARATFFVLGAVADRTPGVIADIESAGHEVALHGYAHVRAGDLGPRGFEDDLKRGLDAVAGRARTPVCGFRAAEWSLTARTPWAFEILAAHGFRYDSSHLPLRFGIGNGLARRPHAVETPRGPVWEVPLTSFGPDAAHGPPANGVCVRLLPVRFLARGIRALHRRGIPAVLCAHPWEMDAGQPRIRLPLFRGAAHYVKLGAFAPKLAALLDAFRWGTAGEAVDAMAHGGPVV